MTARKAELKELGERNALSGGLCKIGPEAIRKFRRQHGLTQKEMGDLCGVSPSAIHQWESGGTVSGSSAIVLRSLIEGGDSIHLSRDEERLLDEAVRRGGFANRRDFLASALLGIIRDGTPVCPADRTESAASGAPPSPANPPSLSSEFQPLTPR